MFIYPIYNHNWRNIGIIYVFKTRLASNQIFSPSNKIHEEVGRAKDLSAPRYMNACWIVFVGYKYLSFLSCPWPQPLECPCRPALLLWGATNLELPSIPSVSKSRLLWTSPTQICLSPGSFKRPLVDTKFDMSRLDHPGIQSPVCQK